MGCGTSATQRASGPGDEVEPTGCDNDELQRELYGERHRYNKKTGEAAEGQRTSERKEDDELFNGEDAGSGDQFGACKPWIGALVAPTKPPPINPAEPDCSFKLEYVYGYRSYDCRQNLFYTNTGSIVYSIAALGVILDPATNTQKFFGGGESKSRSEQHDDDILCLSVSPNKDYVATGQVGPSPKLYIWSAADGSYKAKCKIANKAARGIGSCSWSSDAKYVALTDKSDKWNAYVVEASSGKTVWTDTDGGQENYDVAWTKAPDKHIFATCGQKHITFWDVDAKTKNKGVGHNAQTFTCVTFDDEGTCYAGGIDGNVYVFKGNEKKEVRKAHDKIITTISWVNGKLYTGGADKTIRIDCKTSIPVSSAPRAIDVKGSTILVGLRDGTICTVEENGKVSNEYMKSHHDGEVWGLDMCGTSGEPTDVITTGDDNKIMVWDPVKRKNKGIFTINEKAGPKKKYGASTMSANPDNQCSRAVAYSSKKKVVAVATNEGIVQIRSSENMKTVVKEISVADRWIECMSYSPSGSMLAVGTHTSIVNVYETDSYSLKGTLKGNSSAILSLDWSKDETYIRTNSEAYELLFYKISAEGMGQDTSGATNTRDMEWATLNTKLGWEVTGVFPSGTDGTHINGVDRSANGTLIATGDDWGMVNVYRYPCRDGGKAKAYRGHSEHVVRIKFGLKDKYLFSIGGQDKALMQWKA